MGTIDSTKSILTQSALDALCEKFHIPDTVHPELPGPNDRIRNSPTEMDLFAFIHHADSTKVRIGEIEVREGEVPLLQLTRDRVVPLAGANDQGNKNEVEQSDHVVHVGGVDIVADDEVQAIVSDKPKRVRKKRKVADGAGGSGLPPKKLREGHGTFGIGANTGGKSTAVLQSLLEGNTLHIEVGVTAVAMLPFITSFVSLTPEREGGGHTDSVTGPNLRTQCAAERFVVLSDSSYHSSTNATDDEVTSIVRSSVPPHPVLSAVVATTIIADVTSAPVLKASTEPVPRIIFRDSAFTGKANQDTLRETYIPKWNVTNDSALDDPDICRGVIDHLAPPVLFSQLHSMDYEQLFVEFNVRAARQTCLSFKVRLRLEHELRGRKKFEGKCAMQADWLKEKDTEIASLKAQLSLKETEAAEAIRLRGQVATVEAAEASRSNELNVLKERNSALEEEKGALESKVATLESADATKVAELASLTTQVAKLTKDLSELGLACDELSIKASSLEVEKDRLVGQQIEAVQDEHVRVFSEKVAGLDANLMGMALHLDGEFYPHYLTTIAGRRWILSRGLKLVVMKFLQSPEYLAALGGAIGRTIDKDMQDGLATDIDHGKAGRVLANVAAYNPSAEAGFVFAVNALLDVDFPLLAQLASQKDVMGLLHLEGPAAETPKAEQLQPSPEQLMIHFHCDATSQHLSITDAMVPLIEPLSAENLIGEASTSGVPAMTTALSTTFVQTSSVPPISVADPGVLSAEQPTEVPSPPKIVFEKEELDTTSEHTTAD
ncbi:hypothetical protein Tco_0445375 [Tanacetum coccineum]